MSGFYLAEHFVDHKKVPRHGCGGGEEADGTFRVEVPTQKPKVPVPVLKAALEPYIYHSAGVTATSSHQCDLWAATSVSSVLGIFFNNSANGTNNRSKSEDESNDLIDDMT